MTIERNRLDYVDWVKAIGIILICLGHLLPSGCLPKVVMYCFHVPIFAFVGGILIKAPRTLLDLGKKLLKLVTRILIPYTVWFWLFAIPYFLAEESIPAYITSRYEFTEIVERFFFLEGKTIWNYALWFVPCYFLVSVVFSILCFAVRGNRIATFALSALSFHGFAYYNINEKNLTVFGHENFLGISNIMLLFGFVALGYSLAGLIGELMTLREKRYKNPFLYFSLFAFALGIMAAGHLNSTTNLKKYPAGFNPISVMNGDYNNDLTFLLLAIWLTVTFTVAMGLLPKFKPVQMLSASTFFVMSTHYVVFLFPFISTGLTKAEWQLDMKLGFIECGITILCYTVLLFLLNLLAKRFPKVTDPILKCLGIQRVL